MDTEIVRSPFIGLKQADARLKRSGLSGMELNVHAPIVTRHNGFEVW